MSLALPPRVIPTTLPTTPPAPVGTDDFSSASANDRDSTGGKERGPGSGGGTGDMFAGDIFGPTPFLDPISPAGAPPADKRKHDVQFWIRADGRVTKIEVSPPIKDSGYRRRFMEAMSDIVFGPVKTRDGRPIDYVYSIVVNP